MANLFFIPLGYFKLFTHQQSYQFALTLYREFQVEVANIWLYDATLCFI